MPPRVKLNRCFRQIPSKNYTNRCYCWCNAAIVRFCALWLCLPAQCIAFWSRFVNYCLYFSLFLHCLRSKIRIFYSLGAAIITFITIIPQFAAIFKCSPPTNTNKPSNRRKISLKSRNFFPKNSNIPLRQQKSPSSAAITVHNQDVSPYPRFFFVFISSDFYLFDI